MNKKITSHTLPYPNGYEPNIIIPKTYGKYRYAIGKQGNNPLVVICMNPSAANEKECDLTINRIIKICRTLNYDGWMVFNLYPERATNAKDLSKFNKHCVDKNIKILKEFLISNKISEVWGAWGNTNNIECLRLGKDSILSLLNENNINVFYFGSLTKSGNPKHPLQRNEKINYNVKNIL